MSDDISITVYNKTPHNYTFVFFQQDRNINGMFTNIFPTAWEVIKLGGVNTGGSSSDQFVYPVQMQIGVTEHNTPYPSTNRYRTQNAELNSKWEFTVDTDDYQHLKELSEKNTDGTISCVNHARKKVDIAICKNSQPLIVFRGDDQDGVEQGGMANLLLTPKIYVMWASHQQVGTMFSSYVSSEEVREINLTDVTSVSISLVIKDTQTGLKDWEINTKP